MLELRLTLRTTAAVDRDYWITLDPELTVGELATALRPYADGTPTVAPGPSALACRRLGGAVPSELSVASSGLLDGDVVAVAAGRDRKDGRRVPAAPGYLVVRSGADAGRWLALASGRNVLGRGPTAGLVLSDPSVSRSMAEVHVDVERGRSSVEIVGCSAANPLTVDGAPIDRPTALLPGSVVGAGQSQLTLVTPSAAGPGTIGVHRPPRPVVPFAPPTVHLPVPPAAPGRGRFPVISFASALLTGVLMMLLFRNKLMLVFIVLTPVTLVASFLESRRDGKAGHRQAMAAWRARLGEETRRLDIARDAERIARLAESPLPEVLAARAVARSTSLWERSLADRDALAVQLGRGSQPSRSIIDVGTEGPGNDRLSPEVDAIVRRFACVDDVPVCLDLDVDRVVGLAGGPGIHAVAQSVVLQLCTLLSPVDLQVLAFVPNHALSRWAWMRWLPHGRGAALSSLGDAGPVVDDAEAIARAVRDLGGLTVGDDRTGGGDEPIVVLVIEDGAEVSRAAMGRLLQDVGASRLRVLWVAGNPVRLPTQCSVLIATDGDASLPDALTVSHLASGASDRVRAGHLSAEAVERWARSLAPLRDLAAPTDGVGALARLVPLSSILGGLEVLDEAERVHARWREGRPLEAPLGLGVDGAVMIDLRVDGPHALVAGTTGSGKSELLQTWIASLAASLPPERLQFLLVDYKGGAAFRECSELPHTGGFITDLTPHLARRALIALNAELRRREAILNEHRAKDLIDLERRNLAAAPPSLMVVVDEFAALAGEIPEFVDGVIDVAQRGRSLGIHLVLATQRPAGVVTGSLRANMNMRIALRTAPGESEDVIGTAEASFIDTPGRAYVQIGARKPVAVQTAFGGATTRAGDDSRIVVVALDVAGRPLPAPVRVPAPAADATVGTAGAREDVSDLQRLVATIGAAFVAGGVATPVSPIPAPLPELLPLATLDRIDRLPGQDRPTTVAFGLVDEPETQRQYPAVADLDVDGGMVVFGASGAGKSTALCTLVVALAERLSSDRLAVYGIDSGRGLRPLAALPQVGEVVRLDDAERVTRLFAMARSEIDARAARFAELGIASLAELERTVTADPAAPAVPCRLVLAIDGLPAFLAMYGTRAHGYLSEEVGRLAADGRSVGVHVIASADRYVSLPSEVRSAFRRRLVLRQTTADDYSVFGLRVSDDEIDLGPGRGFVDGREVQVAIVGSASSGAALLRAVEQAGCDLAACDQRQTPSIPVLPDQIDQVELAACTRSLEPVIGRVDDLATSSFALALWDDHLLVTGPPRSGRSNLVCLLAGQLTAAGERVLVASPAGRGLTALDARVPHWIGPDAVEDGLRALDDELTTTVSSGTSAAPLVVVVDDWHELHESGALDELLMAVVRHGRDLPVRVVVSCDNHTARRPYSSVLDKLRRARHGLQLVPHADDELTFDAAVPGAGRRFPPGRGLAVRRDGVVGVVQVALVPAPLSVEAHRRRLEKELVV